MHKVAALVAALVAVAALLAAGCVEPDAAPAEAVPDPPVAAPVVELGPDGSLLTVEPFAGHAVVKAEWTGIAVELTAPGQPPRTYGPADGELVLGFLRPGTTYAFTARGVAQGEGVAASGSFTTAAGEPWGDGLVRPGVRIAANVAYCSLAFILRDATNASLYALTAGHCVTAGGPLSVYTDRQDVAADLVGSVVHVGAAGADDFGDWALARIDDAARARVHPQVEHWSGPTAVYAEPAAGSTACHIGWGTALGYTNESQPRCGRIAGFADDAAGVLEFDGVVAHGDSGSPVIEHATGRAMGVIVRAEPGRDFGAMDLCHLLLRLHDAGYDLALAGATYAPRPAPAITESPVDGALGGGAPTPCPPHLQAGYWP